MKNLNLRTSIHYQSLTNYSLLALLIFALSFMNAEMANAYDGNSESENSILLTAKHKNELSKEITGTVTDAETGDSLPGVNVFVEGTSVGTSTDAEGKFSLSVADTVSTLTFSYIGYKTKKVPIQNQEDLNIQLESKTSLLSDVVVVGFGEQEQKDVTGSISGISAEEIQSVPTTNFQNAIQGKLAGVNVQQSSGRPGATPEIRVRGTGSITAGNDPLYVVDGVPLSGFKNLRSGLYRRRASFQPGVSSPLSTLNSNDISSINTLKGPSATAIYGSRGSNGVIIIETNKGSKDTAPQVSFSAYAGGQQATNLPDMMSSEELIDYTQDARNNTYLQDYDINNPSSPDYNPNYDPTNNDGRPDVDRVLIPDQYINWDGETNTDWLDEVLSPAVIMNYDLSIAGGSDNTTYYLSGGYFKQDGTIEGSGFDRYSLKTNIESDVIEDRLKIGANVNAAFSKSDRMPANAPYFARPPGIIYSALVHSPVIKPYNSDGTPNQLNGQSYLSAGTTNGGTTTASNPLAIMNAISDNTKHKQMFGNVYARLDINPDLYFRTSIGGSINNYNRSFYRAGTLYYRDNTDPTPYAQQNSSQGINWVSRNTLNYSTDFGENNELKVLAGFTAQKNKIERNEVHAKDFPDDKVHTVNGGIIKGGNGFTSKWSLVSYLGRVNYTYKDKYLFTGTVRSDRSSRFGSNEQTGVFPSVAVGWRVKEESFLNSLDALSQFKLRASYGLTGNFSIPDYGSYSTLGEANYILNGSESTGLGPTTLGNKDLSWESTKQLNVGLDIGFLDNRFEGTVDYYIAKTKDLLLNVTLPSSSGFQNVLTNIGRVKNTGVEFSISSRNLIHEFQWSTDLNFSANQNEVTALGPNNQPIRSAGAAGVRSITRVGDPVGSYFGYVVDGIYQSQQEIGNSPVDTQAPDPRPGDFKFKDVDGDGKITPDDRTVTGNYQPDFTFGITNRFDYKGFDFSVFVQGVKGRDILNLSARHLKNGEANFNSYGVLTKRWRSQQNPGNGNVPRADRQSATHGNNNRPSSYQVEDGSYIRIKNVTLGYTLGSLKNLARKVRFFVQATNLHMFTPYRGFNPEVNLQAGNSLVQGEDYGAYPLSRTITGGINIKF